MAGRPEHGHQYPLFSQIPSEDVRKGIVLPQNAAKKVDTREVVVPQSLPCLSVKQPWAGWNIDGVRQVEVRTWEVNYRGLLLIQAGKKIDLPSHPTKTIPAQYFLETGAILGYVILKDVYRIEDKEEWEDLRPETLEFGPFPERVTVYAWKLRRPTRFPTLIPLRGQLGLQRIGVDRIIRFIAEQNGEAAAEIVLTGLREAQAEFLRIEK